MVPLGLAVGLPKRWLRSLHYRLDQVRSMLSATALPSGHTLIRRPPQKLIHKVEDLPEIAVAPRVELRCISARPRVLFKHTELHKPLKIVGDFVALPIERSGSFSLMKGRLPLPLQMWSGTEIDNPEGQLEPKGSPKEVMPYDLSGVHFRKSIIRNAVKAP